MIIDVLHYHHSPIASNPLERDYRVRIWHQVHRLIIQNPIDYQAICKAISINFFSMQTTPTHQASAHFSLEKSTPTEILVRTRPSQWYLTTMHCRQQKRADQRWSSLCDTLVCRLYYGWISNPAYSKLFRSVTLSRIPDDFFFPPVSVSVTECVEKLKTKKARRVAYVTYVYSAREFLDGSLSLNSIWILTPQGVHG